MARLILASASPPRLDLLRQIGIAPDLVLPTDIDETPRLRETPAAHARRLAREKAACGAADPRAKASHSNNGRRDGDAVVLAADTVVACGRRILPKAETEAQARRCLELLSGRRHRVLTGVCVTDGRRYSERLVTSVVTFKRLTDTEIATYLASGEWHGKAGGYAIQGLAAAYVRWLAGSYSSVVGLPLYETATLLAAYGICPAIADPPAMPAASLCPENG